MVISTDAEGPTLQMFCQQFMKHAGGLSLPSSENSSGTCAPLIPTILTVPSTSTCLGPLALGEN